MSAEDISSLFQKINGVLFTGGPDKPHTHEKYFETAKQLFQLVWENDDVPLWGTCLGFETIISIVAGDEGDGILGNFDAEKLNLPLNITEEGKHSRIVEQMNENVFDVVINESITTNWHSYGVSDKKFSDMIATEGFIAVTTNEDRQKNSFVSTLEHKSKLIFSTQWHPEANQFDTDDKSGDPTPNRSQNAVEAMQFFSNFFVNMSRNNNHKFSGNEDFKQNVIGGGDSGGVSEFDGFVYYF